MTTDERTPAMSLRQRWADGQETLGAWLTLANTHSAEAVASMGFAYVCVDTQHGAVDYQVTVELIRAIEHAGSTPIVRVPWNEPGIIGKMLDAGAEGVIIPMVNTVAEAEAAVAACRYAPHGGSRSFGPTVVANRHDDYVTWARDHVAVIPMIETEQAVSNLADILQRHALELSLVATTGYGNPRSTEDRCLVPYDGRVADQQLGTSARQVNRVNKFVV